MPASKKEQEVADHAKLIINKGLSLGMVNDEACRPFRNTGINVSAKTIPDTSFAIV